MLRIIFITTSLLIITGLVGCLPVRSTYYHIASTVGTIGGGCGTIGKSTSLSFTRGDVKINIPEIMVMGNQATLEIVFLVPKNDTVELDWKQLQAINDLTKKPIASEPIDVIAFSTPRTVTLSAFKAGIIKLEAGVTLEGNQNPVDWGGGIYSAYDISLSNFPKDSTPAFELRIPDIKVNGHLYPGFVIHYQLTTSIWLQPANCG